MNIEIESYERPLLYGEEDPAPFSNGPARIPYLRIVDDELELVMIHEANEEDLSYADERFVKLPALVDARKLRGWAEDNEELLVNGSKREAAESVPQLRPIEPEEAVVPITDPGPHQAFPEEPESSSALAEAAYTQLLADGMYCEKALIEKEIRGLVESQSPEEASPPIRHLQQQEETQLPEELGREAAAKLSPALAIRSLLRRIDIPDQVHSHPRRFAKAVREEIGRGDVDEIVKAVRSACTEANIGAASAEQAEEKLDDAIRALRSHRHGEFRARNEGVVLAEVVGSHFGDSKGFLEDVLEKLE